MGKPKLCWECRRKRALHGLAAARARGARIGRVRLRNDVLIHSLLAAGMSFRQIAKIAKCSHGSVSASKKEYLEKQAKEKAARDAKVFAANETVLSPEIVEKVEAANIKLVQAKPAMPLLPGSTDPA